jgi:peptidyl-prolyl cis-trans isomerase C
MFALPTIASLSRAALALAASAALLAPLAAAAQNVAIVNGKPVPKARVEALMAQATSQGQPVTPELESQVRDEVVLREMFVQEAERQGLPATPAYKNQMELARQSILIRELFTGYQKKHPVTEADVQAEYDKFKAQASGSEYAYHSSGERRRGQGADAQIKGGASFEELAGVPGPGRARAATSTSPSPSYVPEFGHPGR